MHLATDGAFLTYLLGVPGSHPLVGKRGWPLVEQELWGALALMNAGALVAGITMLREKSLSWAVGGVATVFLGIGWGVYQVVPLRRQVLQVLPDGAVTWSSLVLVILALGGLVATFWRRPRSEGAAWWMGAVVLLVPLTALMRAHHGGFVNVLMPGIWVLAVGGCLTLARLGDKHWVLAVLVSIMACGPGIQERWDPADFVPTAADQAAQDTLRDAVAALEGPVLMPHAAWLPVQAGKAPSFPLIALWDVDHYRSPYTEEVKRLDAALAEQRWGAILTAGKGLGHGMAEHYRKDHKIRLASKAGLQKTGWKVRPLWVWLPIEPAHQPPE
jgi:hypothetical protein